MSDLERLRAERMDILARMVQDLTRELDDARKEIAVKRAAIELLTRQARAMREALEKADSILWMAERWAEGGGRHSVEQEEYQAASDMVRAALAGEGTRE